MYIYNDEKQAFTDFLTEQGLSPSSVNNYLHSLMNTGYSNHQTAKNWFKKFRDQANPPFKSQEERCAFVQYVEDSGCARQTGYNYANALKNVDSTMYQTASDWFKRYKQSEEQDTIQVMNSKKSISFTASENTLSVNSIDDDLTVCDVLLDAVPVPSVKKEEPLTPNAEIVKTIQSMAYFDCCDEHKLVMIKALIDHHYEK